MKKLLFMVAVATISLTTSCKKSCESCTWVVTQNGKETSNTPIEGADKCAEALKSINGTSNNITIGTTTTTSVNTINCK
jgi:hypothetical protein